MRRRVRFERAAYKTVGSKSKTDNIVAVVEIDRQWTDSSPPASKKRRDAKEESKIAEMDWDSRFSYLAVKISDAAVTSKKREDPEIPVA